MVNLGINTGGPLAGITTVFINLNDGTRDTIDIAAQVQNVLPAWSSNEYRPLALVINCTEVDFDQRFVHMVSSIVETSGFTNIQFRVSGRTVLPDTIETFVTDWQDISISVVVVMDLDKYSPSPSALHSYVLAQDYMSVYLSYHSDGTEESCELITKHVDDILNHQTVVPQHRPMDSLQVQRMEECYAILSNSIYVLPYSNSPSVMQGICSLCVGTGFMLDTAVSYIMTAEGPSDEGG